MNTKLLGGILLVILLGVGLYTYLPKGSETIGSINSFEECAAAGYPIMESFPRQCRANDQTFTEKVSVEQPNEKDNLIRVTSPRPNDTITSPLTLKGEARGNWYFEASFPVEILDANGKRLVQVPVQANGEWMTTEFVPFETKITFSKPTTATGIIVLHKDNPSGLPEHDDKLEIPVRFNLTGTGATTTTTRSVKIFTYNESKDKDSSGNVLCSAKGLESTTEKIPFTSTPIQDTLRAFLSSQIPGVTLTGATLKNGTLTIGLNDPQNKTTGGACKVSILRAQLEATARQFSEVSRVEITPNTLFQP